MAKSSNQSITFIFERDEDFDEEKDLSQIIMKSECISKFIDGGGMIIFNKEIEDGRKFNFKLCNEGMIISEKDSIDIFIEKLEDYFYYHDKKEFYKHITQLDLIKVFYKNIIEKIVIVTI